ncbi:hypothetical protein BGW80DRAFT_1252545 [Lactifluus volemus]|nr:hypothetical protein BGW80DRAFT_1252545 [Lactifluus volemus]
MTLPSKLGQRHDRSTPNGTALAQQPTDPDRLRVKQLETFNNRLQEQVLTLQRQLEHLQADFSSTKMELEHQRSANTLLVSQKGQLSVELAQACAVRQVQATEVHKLRTSYAELANSVRTLASNGEELRTLKSFLTKTDDYSGQQIVQAVHDLNTEILQLAAAVSDEFPLTRRSPGLWNESHCELVREAIGDGMLALLRDGDHEDDPTIVQLAVQRGKFGVAAKSSIPSARGFKQMSTNHKRRPPAGEVLPICHVGGILAILALAGCTDERGVHREPLRARFGDALSHIAERTEALARVLREGVSSAWFEVVVERPCTTPAAPRGKGSAQDVWPSCRTFNPTVMENMYAGYGSEDCGVLCTVAFGLSVVKRRKEGEDSEDSHHLDMKGEAGAARSRAEVLETTLLVKPKVLLESVKELL